MVAPIGDPFRDMERLTFGACVYLTSVTVSPAVYPRLFAYHHFDIQNTAHKSLCVNTTHLGVKIMFP